jgi:hypothetical protein
MSSLIIAISNKDVKLTTTDNWVHIARKSSSQLHGRRFFPQEREEEIVVPVRALGIVYGHPKGSDYFDDLKFPLLDVNLRQIYELQVTHITLLLTDQSNSFDVEERMLDSCPYWTDTITLKPLLERYLREKFPQVEVVTITVTPPQEYSFGSWKRTVNYVQGVFSKGFKYDYILFPSGIQVLDFILQHLATQAETKFLVNNGTKEGEIIDLS